MEMSRNQHFRHVASPTKVSPVHAAAIRASDEFDKAGLVSWHLSMHHDALVLEKGARPEQDVLPALPSSPTQLIKDLKPMLLKDMKLGKVHKGRVLRGTFCTKTVKLGAVVNVLEDETGMATLIFMQNMVSPNCSMAVAQKLFPTGLQVAVRDPYLHEHDDGMIGILVERPADLVILRLPDPEDEPVQGAPVTNSEQSTAAEREERHRTQDTRSKPSIARKNDPAGNETVDGSVVLENATVTTPDRSTQGGSMASHDDEETKENVTFKLDSGTEVQQKAQEQEGRKTLEAQRRVPEEAPTNPATSTGPERVAAEGTGITSPDSSAQKTRKASDALVSHSPAIQERRRKQETGTKPSIPQEIPNNGPAGNETGGVPVVHESIIRPDRSIQGGDTPKSSMASHEDEETKESGTFKLDSGTDVQEREQGQEGSKTLGEVQPSLAEEVPTKADPGPERIAVEEAAPSTLDGSARETRKALGTLGSHSSDIQVSDAPKETKALKLKEIQLREQGHEDTELELKAGATKSSPLLDAASLRRLGNGKFAQRQWTKAVQLYSSAITEAQKGKVNSEELLLGYSNRAEAYLRLQEYNKARSDAEAALAIQGKHAKSLYRMGRAFMGIGEYEKARHYLKAASELAPRDKDLKQSLLECKHLLRARNMCSKRRKN